MHIACKNNIFFAKKQNYREKSCTFAGDYEKNSWMDAAFVGTSDAVVWQQEA
jgi:hypothetical protein